MPSNANINAPTIEPIGFLNEDRLRNIPNAFWHRHEFLIYLFVQIQDLVLKAQENADRSFAINIDELADREAFVADPLKYAATHLPHGRRAVIQDIALALMADFLSFSHVSFTAFENRQFSPGFANLRKPLQETLILLTWICGDPDNFLDCFCEDPPKYFQKAESDSKFRRELYKKAKDAGATTYFEPEQIEQLIYDKAFENGLAPLMHKAMHLWTSRGTIRTEDMNLNWIFKDPRQNDVFDSGYYLIAAVFLHAYQILHAACERIHERGKKHKVWLDIALFSSFECIFLDRNSDISSAIFEDMAELLVCIQCSSPLELDISNTLRFVMLEKIECRQCGEFQSFPLNWIFCREEMDENGTQA